MSEQIEKIERVPALSGVSWVNELTALSTLAIPLILTNVSQVLIQTTDVIMLGRLGKEELAAGAIGAQVRFILMIFCIGLIVATAPIMAQYRGARWNDVRNIRNTMQQGLWISTLLSAPCIVILIFTEPLLLLFGQSNIVADGAGDYALGSAWGYFPLMWYIALRNFVSALERAQVAAIAAFIGVLVNIIANYLLMFGPLHMGVGGAGLGTGIANMAMAGFLLFYILIDRRFRRYGLLADIRAIDWIRIREITNLGLPIAIAMTMEMGIFVIAAFLVGTISETQLAAHQIAMQLVAFSFMIPLGLAQASTVRVGMAAGRQDRDGVTQAGLVAIGLTLMFVMISAVTAVFFPEHVSAIFLDIEIADNRDVLPYAVLFLQVCAVLMILDGIQVSVGGVLRGLKDTRGPMMIAIFCYWVVGGIAVYFSMFIFSMEGFGIWLSLTLSVTVAAVLLIWRFYLLRKRIGV